MNAVYRKRISEGGTVVIQLARTGLMTIAWLTTITCLMLLLGAVAPVIPRLSLLATSVVPNHISWLLLIALVCLACASLLHIWRRTSVARNLIILSVATTLLAGVMTGHLLYIAHSQNAHINLLQTLSSRNFSEQAKPDQSYIYSNVGNEKLALDVYRPPNAGNAITPIIVVVHGGGFVQGNRLSGAGNLNWYADRGWTVISVDYRLARPDRPTWNLAIRDIECALAWIADHAGQLHVDTDRLALTGGSAGGSLAMRAAYSTATEHVDPVCGPKMPRIRALAVKVPLIDPIAAWNKPGELNALQRRFMTRYVGGSPEQFPERYRTIELQRFTLRSNPPTLILGGADDPLVPPESAISFTQQAQSIGAPVQILLFPYSGHDFNTTFGSITNQTVLQSTASFLKAHGLHP